MKNIQHGNQVSFLFPFEIVFENANFKLKRRIRSKIPKKRVTTSSNDLSVSNLNSSSRSSSKYQFRSNIYEDSNQNISWVSEVTCKGNDGVWDRWWIEKEENENRFK